MRLIALRCTVVLLTVLVALPAGFDAGLDAGASKRIGKGRRHVEPKAAFEVVTRAFDSAVAVAIPLDGAATPYPAQIAVSGLAQGRLLDVDLELRGLSHTYPDDVDVLLVAPGGRTALVMSDAGAGADAASLTLTLDDEAAAALPDTTALANGSHRPTNNGPNDVFPAPAPAPGAAVAMSTFDGIDPNGTWSLFVADDDANNESGGIANGWKLTMVVEIPIPPALAPMPDPDDNAKGRGKGKKGKGKGKNDGGGKEKGKSDGKGKNDDKGKDKDHDKGEGHDKGKGKGNGGKGNGRGDGGTGKGTGKREGD